MPTLAQVHGACVPYTQDTITLTTDASTPAGALLVLVAGTDYAPSGGAVGSPGTKWTEQNDAVGYPFAGKVFTATAAAAGGSEDVSVTFSSSSENAAILWVVPDATVDAAATAGDYTGTSQPAPSVTATTPDDLLLCAWMTNAGPYTLPTSMTQDFEQTESSGFMTAAAAHEALTTSGATGTRTATHASGPWVAFTIAVQGTGSQPETHSLSATGALSMTGTASQVKTAGVAAGGTLELAGTTGEAKTAPLDGSSTLSLDSQTQTAKTASLTATGTLDLVGAATVYNADALRRDIALTARLMLGWSAMPPAPNPVTAGPPTRSPLSVGTPTGGEWSVSPCYIQE